jgi:thioredoxin reductase (NADPH)
MAHPKIKFIWNSVVYEVKGDKTVRSVMVKNVKTHEVTEVETEGVFLFVGISPRTHFLRGVVEMDEGGYILTDENCGTSVKGIFAIGDCRKKLLRQVTTAVGDGATAAFSAEQYLENKEKP